MGNNDLAVRFTENNYATKNEVSRELKISVIDGVWDKILSYRSPFYQYLSIRGIDKNKLRICLCPTVSGKANAAETKLIRLLNEFRKLNRINGDSKYFEQSNLIKCLQNVAAKKDLICEEDVLKDVIHGIRANRDLFNYVESLKHVEAKYSNTIDIDYLADLYSLVTGNPELTSFYRDTDLEDSHSMSIISRRYKSAPHALIEQMMDGLFSFIQEPQLGALTKTLITFYYVEFVKPFKLHNDEIAILLAKSVLAHESVGEFAAYFPLETLLNDNPNEVNRLFGEVQATSDTTYYVSYALDSVNRLIDKMLDNIAEYSSQMIRDDFYKADEVEETPKEEAVKAEPQPVISQSEPTPIVREVVREIIREVPVPAPTIETPKAEPQKAEKAEMPENKPQGLAISYIPEELDEKTALRLERHLLELDVRLKKGQAHFYARHCTLGMYYTIDQYKKAVKCVYETARTSMEQLVEFGYYEKKQFGKKFVYTPKERK